MTKEKSVKVRFIEKQLSLAQKNYHTISVEVQQQGEIAKGGDEYMRGLLVGRKEAMSYLVHLLDNCAE